MQNQTQKFPITWEQVHRDALRLADKLKKLQKFDAIIAVCRGGLVPASLVARALDIHIVDTLCFETKNNQEELIKTTSLTDKNLLIVDDIVNTGRTAKVVRRLFPNAHYASLYVKDDYKELVDTYITDVNQETWFVFPWEQEEGTNMDSIAGAISFLTYPFFQRLQEKHNVWFSLTIYYCCLALVVIIPIILITVLVTPQAVNGYKTLMLWIDKGLDLPPAIGQHITAIYGWLETIPGFQDLQSSTAEISAAIKRSLSSFLQLLLTGSISFAGSTINIAMQLFLIIFLSGLAVVYAKTCHKLAVRVTALPVECIDRFIIALQSTARSIFFGVFFIAFIQGILTGIGFFIFGVKDAAFWGLAAMICAVIPILGTALIWVPIAITVWVGGSFYSAVGIVLWGAIIVAGADG